MRLLLAVFVLLGVAAAAAAQSHGHGLTDEMPIPSIGLPLPQIGLPLAPIGLPLPPMGLPPSRLTAPERLGRSQRFERPERSERSHRVERPGSFVFFGWPYLPVEQFPAIPTAVPPLERAVGRLRLVLSSGVDPQILVDGYYAGLFSDVAGELTLDTGAHTVELREEGYDPVRVPVNIQPDAVLVYDVFLPPHINAPLPAVEPVSEPAPPPSTIYVIPGCYVGNVPPRQVSLPAGCDARNAIEFPSR
jgi:hypothetical protein